MKTKTFTRQEGVLILSTRHAEQAERYPARMAKVPLEVYLRRNLPRLMDLNREQFERFSGNPRD